MNKQNNPGLGLIHAIFVVVASMLGTGVLTTTGLMAQVLPSAWLILLVWLVGGLLALLGARCYGVLMAQFPCSGGEAALIHRFYSPGLGYLVGLLSFAIGFATSNAATSLALAAYLRVGLQHFPGGLVLPDKMLALLAIFLMTAVHSLRGPVGMRFQTALAIGKYLVLLGIALYGLRAVDFAHLRPPVELAPLGQMPVVSVFFWVVLAYSGWNAAIYAATEFSHPERTIPRALLIGTGLVVGLYLLLNFVILGVLGTDEIAGVIPIIALLVDHLFGAGASGVFAMVVAVALLSSIGVSSFAGPRVLHVVLRNSRRTEDAPLEAVSRWLIWLQAGVSSVMVLSGTFEQILTVMGIFLGIFPVLTVLAIYREKHWEAVRPSGIVRLVFAPVFLLVSMTFLGASTWQYPGESFLAVGLVSSFLLARSLLGRWRRAPVTPAP